MTDQSIFHRLRRWIGVAAAVFTVLAGMVGCLLVIANLVNEAMHMTVTEFATPVPAEEKIAPRIGASR